MGSRARRARIEIWGSTFLASLGFAGCGPQDSVPCANPEPILVDGEDTGFVQCDGGWRHRPARTACASDLPRADFTCESDFEGDCEKDADCAHIPHGFCTGGDFEGGCSCRSGCVTDADCGEDAICVCGGLIGSCVQSTCANDGECGEGLLCSSYVTEPGCGGPAFQCQSPEDECGGDEDCPDGYQCTSNGERKYCGSIDCAIGRPFLVDGKERLATVESREDWSADVAPTLDGLDATARSGGSGVGGPTPYDPLRGTTPPTLDEPMRLELTRYWANIARMEHASIAAFARFSLQLLSLGAPPELVSRAQSAMADETRHARLAFALASGYGAEALGPGALAMENALADSSLEAVLATVIVEGCLGETVAALEAKEALEHVTDPALRFVLREIARDEQEHAVLAWRTVSWMCEAFADRALPVVERVVAELRTSITCEDPLATSPADEALLARGCVTDAVRAELRQGALRSAILPGLEAILRGDDAPPSLDGARLTLV